MSRISDEELKLLRERLIAGLQTQTVLPFIEEILSLRAEIERYKVLVKIADVLITNENALEDWENAKRTRVM